MNLCFMISSIILFAHINSTVCSKYSDAKEFRQAWSSGVGELEMSELSAETFCKTFQEKILPRRTNSKFVEIFKMKRIYIMTSNKQDWILTISGISCNMITLNKKTKYEEIENWKISPMGNHRFCRVVNKPDYSKTRDDTLLLDKCYKMSSGFAGTLKTAFRKVLPSGQVNQKIST